MPYYSWSGINLWGELKNGKQFARSRDDLEKKLLKNEIGLLQARESTIWGFYNISGSVKNEFLSSLSILLAAKIPLYNALKININTIKNNYLKNIIEDVSLAISEGYSLSSALSYYKNVFDELTRALVAVGEKSGNLSHTLKDLSEHWEKMQKFKQDIRSALLLPIITLILFFLIMLSIFWFVIPRFENFFQSTKAVLPLSTRIILNLSSFLRSWNLVYFLIIVICFGLLINLYLKKKTGIKFKHRIVFRIPILNNFMIMVYQARFLQTLDILLSSGVHLVDALYLVRDAINNQIIKKDLEKIIVDVESGKTLASSLHDSKYFNAYELESLILIGESSGQLNNIIAQASLIYQQRIYTKIKNFAFFVQPAMLILLGFLIVGLILAVYLPMFTLSSAIN